MADLKVNFMHPTDGRIIGVDLDDTMTADEAISELITANMIPRDPEGYQLAIKGGATMLPKQTFVEVNATSGCTVRIDPKINAG